MTRRIDGWLLDLYITPGGATHLYLIDRDSQRLRLVHRLPVSFYASGPIEDLRQAWRFLRHFPGIPLTLARDERQHPFTNATIPVLCVGAADEIAARRAFRALYGVLPDLDYFDVDVPVELRYAALFNTFAMAEVSVEVDDEGMVLALHCDDSPWGLGAPHLPLRMLEIAPDRNPISGAPRHLVAKHQLQTRYIDLRDRRQAFARVGALLREYDPDILLTEYGDLWLLPSLIEATQDFVVKPPLNRDPDMAPQVMAERSFFTYGQIFHRDQQITLFGRHHIDRTNILFWGDNGLDGIIEAARVTGQSLQKAARSTPGTGISSMQIREALRSGMLVPYRKQLPEKERTSLDLLQHDMGGLIFQPPPGVYPNVGAVDFISMYPSIMITCNISPETTPSSLAGAGSDPPGLIPRTLKPLLDKRVALKRHLKTLAKEDPRRVRVEAQISSHKWLLVTCFGYLGYKNARFGRIESHEAVTERGREALLLAKEIAEDLGFDVLHGYVDSLYLFQPGYERPSDYAPLLNSIEAITGLPIDLDGIFRWVVFLPSKMDDRVPVPNRFFGVFQDGSVKARGIELRRHDMPPIVRKSQRMMLDQMATAPSLSEISPAIEAALETLHREGERLKAGDIPLPDLVVTHRLSRKLEHYRVQSPAARAASQLRDADIEPQAGQKVGFIYVRGCHKVHAWELAEQISPDSIDPAPYQKLLIDAAETLLRPFGIPRPRLEVIAGAVPGYQLSLW